WLEQMALMEIANIVGADKSSFLAAQAASSWAPAAVAAAIGSYGAAAYIGTAATQAGMLSTTALAVGLSGRASGGPVSSGMPYIVGEKGHELFVPDRDGTIIPNHQLQSYMGGGGGGGGISKNEMHLHLANFLDKDEMARHTFRSKHADVWFNDMMRKNVSRYKRTT
ncbi:MAG TPA: hypothetical protein VHG71_04920, partial [Verrucomicrobiae bacterium]|nr:hypothetical protein [Verrucomicrobiae bacterium]